MSEDNAFEQWIKQNALPNAVHEDNCYYYLQDMRTPVGSNKCNCYDKAIFRAGYRAAKGIKETKNLD